MVAATSRCESVPISDSMCSNIGCRSEVKNSAIDVPVVHDFADLVLAMHTILKRIMPGELNSMLAYIMTSEVP